MTGTHLGEYKKDIIAYCENNRLSPDSVLSAPYSRIGKQFHLLHHVPNNRKKESYNIGGNPCRVILIVIPEEGGIRFEQTEHTRKYLGVEDNAGRRVA